MQKKLIALAIAAAISAPAFADTSNVTVYGLVDASYDSINTGTATSATVAAPATSLQGVRSNRVSSNSSRVGVKGSEDLGSGLSALWQVESQVNLGDTTGTGTSIGTRDTFAGLSSADAGTVLMGRHDTPYKMATRAADLFTDGIADNRSIMGGQTLTTNKLGANGSLTTLGAAGANFSSAAASFDGRQNQVVAYVSPKIGGMFTGIIAYVNLAPTDALVTDNKANATSMAGLFDIGGGFTASVAYEQHKLNSTVIKNTAATPVTLGTLTDGSKESATKLGLFYAQDAFGVNFVYEKTKDNYGLNGTPGSDSMGHSDYYLSGKYMLTASDVIKAAYTHANSLAMDTSSTTGAKQFTLGYDHLLSKRTTVYALYTKLSNDANAGYVLGTGTSSVGGASTAAAASLGGVGASPSAFAFGMRHSF